MARLLTSLLFFFLVKLAASQQPVFQWVKGLNARNTENYTIYSNGRTVGVDGQGNVYSAGLFQHTIDMDPGPGVYTITGGGFLEYGIYISKLNANGNFVWGKQIPLLVEWGSIELKVDNAGNIYLASDLHYTADMDPGPNVFMMMPTGAKDAFVVKLDTDGNLVWAKQFGGPGDTVPYATSLDLDPNNNVIVCGGFNNTVDFDPGPGTYNLTSTAHIQSYIVKLSNSGNFIWAKQFGNGPTSYQGSAITDVECDSYGNICTTGHFSGACDFDPGTAVYTLRSSAGSLEDGFVAKLDAGGNFTWARQIASTTGGYNDFMFSRGLDIDGLNNIVVTGEFVGTRDFDPGPGVYTFTTAGYQDCFILKLDEQGAFLWAKAIGSKESDSGNDVAVDSDNNVYAVGNFTTGSDLDPGPGSFVISNNYYGASALVKLNANGDFLAAAPCYSISYGASTFRRMTVDAARNIYICGAASGSLDFDPGPGQYVLQCSGETPFVYKLAPCAHQTTAVLDVSVCDHYTLNNERFDSSGTYTRIIPNASGCDSIITLHLAVTKKFTQQTKTICEGDFFFAGGANQTTAGTYRDTLQTRLGCDSVVTTTLAVNPRPLPNLGPDKDICSNSQATITPGTFTSYLWQDGSTASAFTIREAGVYWVNVTDSRNCTATDTFRVHTILPAPANFLKEKDSICSYESLEAGPSTTFSSYQWSTGATTRKLTVENPGTYWLTVTGANGCSGTDSITVYPKQCMWGVYVPTAFTPNGDGKNDWFRANVFGKVLSFKLQVFDRWGQVVFQTTDPAKYWDGRNNGSTYPTTVFAWQCSYQLAGQPAALQKGTVLLIR